MCKSGIYLGWERCPVYGGALMSEVQGKGGTWVGKVSEIFVQEWQFCGKRCPV